MLIAFNRLSAGACDDDAHQQNDLARTNFSRSLVRATSVNRNLQMTSFNGYNIKSNMVRGDGINNTNEYDDKSNKLP